MVRIRFDVVPSTSQTGPIQVGQSMPHRSRNPPSAGGASGDMSSRGVVVGVVVGLVFRGQLRVVGIDSGSREQGAKRGCSIGLGQWHR